MENLVTLIQQIVPPAKIEAELLHIWDALEKKNKMRASLFNLIVFNRYSSRTDYIRSIVQKVIERFPCRILFISEDPQAKEPYLKTAVSVASPEDKESTIACDQIDVGVGGSDLERVPYLILPHLLPDLPVTLLWAEDPSKEHPLFEPLSRLADRVIFDSESADSLKNYAKTALELHEKRGLEVADLNWARTEGWRNLLGFVFASPQRLNDLRSIREVEIDYNGRTTEFFCHLQIQSLYLISWLASRLGWQIKKGANTLSFQFQSETGEVSSKIVSKTWEKLGPGTVISVRLRSNTTFDCEREKDRYHLVNIQISSPEKCELPYLYQLGQTATGQSLVEEICMKGTSSHYTEMLKQLSQLC